MNKQLKKTIKMALALVLALAMTVSLAACGGEGGGTSPSVPEEASDRTVIYFQASNVSAQVQDSYKLLVETYNNGQGVTDGVYVQLRSNSGDISGLDSGLRANYQYDVVELDDDQFKTLALQGKNYFVTLDQFMTDEAKARLSWDDIPESLTNRYRMNTTPDAEDRKYLAGEGADLLALPNGSTPHVLFYNKSILEKCGINIISVPESELEAYNAANGTKLAAHGYAEYKEAPFADAKSSRNELNQFVYKVFNDAIAMNWEELRILSRSFQTQYDYKNGYMSEWWFNYGFSIGGDCIGWDDTAKQYKFTLLDKQPGWLALEDITVGGVEYKKGEALNYDEKTLVNTDASVKSGLNGKIWELPSQYDAILEFTRLGVPASKQVEEGIYGYGVAPSTTANRNNHFTSGTDCPFLVESYENIQSFKGILGDALGVSMPAQYREYVGGSVYESNGVEYLKVIGESYDGEVYTGELHVENGTPIVGELAAASASSGFFLPANTKGKNYEAAFKFASWAAGLEGQKILAANNRDIPNQMSYALGEYASSADRLIPNTYAGALMHCTGDIGDYTYFTSITWITEWSQTFNKNVREGSMTLSQFLEQKQEVADVSLMGMQLHILGR